MKRAFAFITIVAALAISACSNFDLSGEKINPVNGTAVVSVAGIPGVTPPAMGQTPVTTIMATAQYTGTVAWSPAVTTTFAGSQIYTATITLTATTGYTLTGVAANFFTVAGATSATHPSSSGVVTAVFPATGAAEGFVVTYDSQSATTASSPTSQTVNSPATTVGTLPTAPVKTGWDFSGWYTSTGGNGSQFTASTALSAAKTVYAKWTTTKIIAAGNFNNNNSDLNPTCWQGQTATTLESSWSGGAFVTGMLVSAKHIYVLGTRSDAASGNPLPGYWDIDNGVTPATTTWTALTLPVAIADTMDGYCPTSISLASDASIIVTSFYRLSSDAVTRYVGFWKNNIWSDKFSLPVYPFSFAVSSTDSLVVAGMTKPSGKEIPTYWSGVSNVGTVLDPENARYDSRITTTFITGSDWYFGGWGGAANYGTKAVLWKVSGATKSVTVLPSTGSADVKAVAVSGSTVYAAGWTYPSGYQLAKYWQDGNLNNLPNLSSTQNSMATCIAATADRVYIGGECNKTSSRATAGYWTVDPTGVASATWSAYPSDDCDTSCTAVMAITAVTEVYQP